MEDYLLMELLKTKSKMDPEFNSKLTEYIRSGRMDTEIHNARGRRYMRNYTQSQHYMPQIEEEHFDEEMAKSIVESMHHMDDNNKVVSGEHFSMFKANSVCETYKKMYHLDITPEDVYVAINAQYHDYSKLFKSWFGSNVDSKIIESAICFWFKDVDYDKGSKLWNYFQEL